MASLRLALAEEVIETAAQLYGEIEDKDMRLVVVELTSRLLMPEVEEDNTVVRKLVTLALEGCR